MKRQPQNEQMGYPSHPGYSSQMGGQDPRFQSGNLMTSGGAAGYPSQYGPMGYPPQSGYPSQGPTGYAPPGGQPYYPSQGQMGYPSGPQAVSQPNYPQQRPMENPNPPSGYLCGGPPFPGEYGKRFFIIVDGNIAHIM